MPSGRKPNFPRMAVANFYVSHYLYLIAGQRDKDLEVVRTDGLDLLLAEEVIESILEGLEREVNLIHVVPSIQVNDVLILRDAPLRSEASPRFIDQLRYPNLRGSVLPGEILKVEQVRLVFLLVLLQV